MLKYCENAKKPYYYNSYWVSDLLVPYDDILTVCPLVGLKKGRYPMSYYEVYAGFDIETYTNENNEGYMYVWQLSLSSVQGYNVIKGRTWDKFTWLLREIKRILQLDDTHRIILWVANLNYEFQFIRKHLSLCIDGSYGNGFMKDSRHVMYCTHDGCIEFREALSISGGNLDFLARTYCNTQKAVGDLDYHIPRNNLTILSDQEEGYCDNDVLILSDWSRYIFRTYIYQGKLPLTIQSVIRNEILDGACAYFNQTKKEVKERIASLWPSERLYNLMFSWLFRGGYVHGSIAYVDEIIPFSSGCISVDLTSSYPAVIEQCYMPSKFYRVTEPTMYKWQRLRYTSCCFAEFTFTNIKARNEHSIESKSKCINLENGIIDNGRVRYAYKMTVVLNELDYDIYEKYYSWDSVEIVYMYESHKIHIPRYVSKPMEKYYSKKCQLKREGKPYDIEKTFVNSFYGVMVTRLSTTNTLYVEDEYSESAELLYDTQKLNNYGLLPQWGIWITSHARHRLLVESGMYKFPELALYLDTDSIKITRFEQIKHFIANYNRRITKLNRIICEKRGLEYSDYYDLGTFEVEGRCKVKYLGAKRYICTWIKKDKETKKYKLVNTQTIAGLPKKSLIEYCNNNDLDIYEEFKDDMTVNDVKLYSYYNDEPHEAVITDTQGNSVLMSELSSIGLSPSSFTMNLDDIWVELYAQYKLDLHNKEVR